MFCIARAYLLQQNVHIPNEYRNVLELKTVSEAFNIINKEKLNSKGNFDDFKKLFQYFLNGIKPLLYSIEAGSFYFSHSPPLSFFFFFPYVSIIAYKINSYITFFLPIILISTFMNSIKKRKKNIK